MTGSTETTKLRMFAAGLGSSLLFAGAWAQESADLELQEIPSVVEQERSDVAENAAEQETLEEIVLPSQDVFEEDVYFSGNEEIFDPGQAEESDDERIRRLFTLYMDAVSDRQYDEADTLAKQIVEMTISVHGLDSQESASALTNLAIAQHGIDDYESAILNYEAAIGIIERIEDRLNSQLVNPLRGLGAAQLAAGRPDLARTAFSRAIHVSHVNEGPHNLGQVESLQSLAETFLAVGEFNDAIDIQKRIYYLQARNIDAKSIDIIPALRTRAEWQHRVQLYEQERYTLRRIVSIIEDHKGKKSLDLIEPLTELGNSFLFVSSLENAYTQPVSVTSGEVYLKRAVRIAEDNPEADWRILSDAMLELADFYLLSDRANRGHRVYREVWQILSEEPDRLGDRAKRLENVVILHDIDPPKMYGGNPEMTVTRELPGFETGTAEFEYTVSTRGRSTNIRLVKADPEGLNDMYQMVGRQMRRLLHRPRHVEGQAVTTENVKYTHSFYYREADLPDDTSPQSGGEEVAQSAAGSR
ncbi:MAG: tetratricopeptide repeat protein [Pseudomonadota bacterium]